MSLSAIAEEALLGDSVVFEPAVLEFGSKDPLNKKDLVLIEQMKELPQLFDPNLVMRQPASIGGSYFAAPQDIERKTERLNMTNAGLFQQTKLPESEYYGKKSSSRPASGEESQ